MTKRLVFAVLSFLVLSVACKDKASLPSKAVSAAGGTEATERGEGQGQDAHLGARMFELSRRFSAVWFAGQSRNGAMLDYQLHEMGEVIEELEKSRTMEAGIDVAARLNRDIESKFETLKRAIQADDKEKFETTYTTTMALSTGCHVETKHAFIAVKLPEYNPYPNLKF